MKNWSVETIGKSVDHELEQLPLDMRVRFVRVTSLIEEFGPFNVGMPHIRSLGEKLWEIRVSGRDGIGRRIYVVATGKRVVVVHVFVKKTQKTPAAALQTALSRAKDKWIAMTKISTLHDQWLKTPGYSEAYADSHAEFELARQLIEARTQSGLSQEEIASRMGTSQSAVARLESGNSLPSMRTLSRYAKATNCEISIRLQPIKKTPARPSKTGDNLVSTAA